MGTDETVIDLDSSSSEVYGKQEESKYNGYFKVTTQVALKMWIQRFFLFLIHFKHGMERI